MFTIGNTVISEDIVDKFFVCDLQKCKGACCVEGDAGAPLEKKEAMKLEKIYDQIKPYLSKAGIKTIEKEGFYVEDEDGDFSTQTIKGKNVSMLCMTNKEF